MLAFLLANPLVAAALWAFMYIFDYAATIWFARLYRRNPDRHITFEGGVELNPVFEKEIAGLRLVSPRFLFLLVLLVLLLVLIGTFDPTDIGFESVLGACLLMWLFIDLRHLRNIYLNAMLKARPNAMMGQITQSYWLSQRAVSFDAFGFALVCTVACLASGRAFFAGGMLVCAALALRHFLLAKRKPVISTDTEK